jgi:hypothetical protein
VKGAVSRYAPDAQCYLSIVTDDDVNNFHALLTLTYSAAAENEERKAIIKKEKLESR